MSVPGLPPAVSGAAGSPRPAGVPGLPDHLRSGPTLRIPMEPGIESLNAATAAAVALYAWRQSRTRPTGAGDVE